MTDEQYDELAQKNQVGPNVKTSPSSSSTDPAPHNQHVWKTADSEWKWGQKWMGKADEKWQQDQNGWWSKVEKDEEPWEGQPPRTFQAVVHESENQKTKGGACGNDIWKWEQIDQNKFKPCSTQQNKD